MNAQNQAISQERLSGWWEMLRRKDANPLLLVGVANEPGVNALTLCSLDGMSHEDTITVLNILVQQQELAIAADRLAQDAKTIRERQDRKDTPNGSGTQLPKHGNEKLPDEGTYAAQTQALAHRCGALLSGNHPSVQGGALAVLLAKWIVGHRDKEWQKKLLEGHVNFVRELLPVEEKILLDRIGLKP